MTSYSWDLPAIVYLRCDRCGRAGQYSRQRFVEIAGTDNPVIALPAFAQARGCKVALDRRQRELGDRCKIRYDIQRMGIA